MKNVISDAKNGFPQSLNRKIGYTMFMPVPINTKDRQEFGKKLREIRERKNFFQEDVAKAVGISVTYYAGIERGEENPTFSVLGQLCKVLKIKSSEVLPF